MKVFNQVFRGKHSTVYVKKDRAIKVFRPNLTYNFWKEVAFLSYLQPYSFVPRLYSVNPAELSIEMEFIDGVMVKDTLTADVLLKCLDVCRILDRLMIQKEEMNRPEKHIIIRDGRPYFIDFERSVITPKPANVTQFLSYISKVTKTDFKNIVPLAREYKESFSDETYEKLRSALKNLLNRKQ